MLDALSARARRVPPWAWTLAFALALCLPRLGSFGFWDPSELKIADQAREIERSGHLLDPTECGGGSTPEDEAQDRVDQAISLKAERGGRAS